MEGHKGLNCDGPLGHLSPSLPVVPLSPPSPPPMWFWDTQTERRCAQKSTLNLSFYLSLSRHCGGGSGSWQESICHTLSPTVCNRPPVRAASPRSVCSLVTHSRGQALLSVEEALAPGYTLDTHIEDEQEIIFFCFFRSSFTITITSKYSIRYYDLSLPPKSR